MNPIPSYRPFCWSDLAAITVCDNQEPLQILAAEPKIRIRPVYFQAAVAGALPDIWLRTGVVRRLRQAAAQLPEHLGLEILDGWRPLAVQAALRESFRSNILAHHPHYNEAEIQAALDQFVADPYRADMTPPHHTGGSVDLTLFDLNKGKVLDMGTPFDDTDEQSYTAALESGSHAARANRRLLYGVMTAAGFTNLLSEWWHYDFDNQNWAYFGGHDTAMYGSTVAPDFQAA